MQALFKKLHFKGVARIIQAPHDLLPAFIEQGCQTAFSPTSSSNTLVFVSNKEELLRFLNTGLQHIEPDSVFWIAYPKGSSKR